MSPLQWILLVGAGAVLTVAWVAHSPPPHPPDAWAWAKVWVRRRAHRRRIERELVRLSIRDAQRRDMLEPHERAKELAQGLRDIVGRRPS